MMYRRTGLLIAGWSILMMVGCSTLDTDLPATVQTLDNEACETCHSLLPATENHFFHVNGADTVDTNYNKLLPLECDDCHKGYDDRLGWTDESLHRNGVIDTRDNECDYCHDYRRDCGWCHTIPPTATETQKKVHKHVSDQNYACGVCHEGYDYGNRIAPQATHDNGIVNVSFNNAPRKAGFPTNAYYENGFCYNLYCHGASIPGGTGVVSINDVKPAGQQQCDFCHPIGQLLELVQDHSTPGHQGETNCIICHDGFSYTANDQTVDSDKHLDGDADTLTSLCRKCHEIPHP